MLKIIPILFLLFSIACNEIDAKQEDKTTSVSTEKSAGARIKTVHGDIILKFFPKDAPNTVTRIKELVRKGFYNGIVFHRVIPGFVVQGGDPTGTGMHGSGKKLKAEFNSNKHIPGSLAMARSQSEDSADSQFYISLGTHPHLDGKYTVFGTVTKGLEIARKIVQGDKIISFTLE